MLITVLDIFVCCLFSAASESVGLVIIVFVIADKIVAIVLVICLESDFGITLIPFS